MAGQNHKGKKTGILFPSAVNPSSASVLMILSRHDSVHDYLPEPASRRRKVVPFPTSLKSFDKMRDSDRVHRKGIFENS